MSREIRSFLRRILDGKEVQAVGWETDPASDL
jgi:hypothetical protein